MIQRPCCESADAHLPPSSSSPAGRLRLLQQRPPVPQRRPQRLAARAAAAAADPEAPRRRVVVTGQGVVSSLGHDPAQFYDALLSGKSGIRQIQGFDACERGGQRALLPATGRRRRRRRRAERDRPRPWPPPPGAASLPTTIAGEVRDLECSGYVLKKWEKRIDPVMKYTHVSASNNSIIYNTKHSPAAAAACFTAGSRRRNAGGRRCNATALAGWEGEGREDRPRVRARSCACGPPSAPAAIRPPPPPSNPPPTYPHTYPHTN